MSNPLRVGFLGAGYMAGVHASRLKQCGGTEVVAACATTEARAATLLKNIGAQGTAYQDFEKMLSREKLDVLYVCLPPHAHNGQVESAATKGIHLFLEKPIALTEERAQSMVQAVGQAKVITQVGYHNRFGHAVRRLHEMIISREAGPPTMFIGSYQCNCLHSEWWRDVKRSGGQVVEQAIHVYDLATFLFGIPETVTGRMTNLFHNTVSDYTVDDTSAAIVEFQNGALASITASNCAVPMEWNASFSAICGNLTVIFRSASEAIFIHTAEGKAVKETVSREEDLYLLENRNFLAAIAGREPALAPITDGLQSLRVVLGVAASSCANGAPQKLS